MNGVLASYCPNPGQPMEWIIKINPTTAGPLECAVESEDIVSTVKFYQNFFC